MVFALTGFTNESSLRRFTFELAGSGPPRTTMVVVADMALVRKYEIPLQELPLFVPSPTRKPESGHERYGSLSGKGDDRVCQSPRGGEESGGRKATPASVCKALSQR